MSVAQNKALVRQFIREVFEEGRADAVDRLVTPDFCSHGLPGSGPELMKSAMKRAAKGLSDTKMQVEDMFGEGDQVAVRLRSSATHSGEFMGMPPTGKRYDVEEIHVFRVADGHIAEHWHQLDGMRMMRQLGALPANG